MNRTKFQNERIAFEAVAHEEEGRRLLMVKVKALETDVVGEEPPINLSVVIDRSGSMSGRKLEVAKQAAARLVRSLRPTDRVAVVTFDEQVDVVARPTAPTEGLASLIGLIDTRGSTNLYGGWVTGAKLLSPGGRVLLLSDGQANVGPYTDAAQLSAHAALSYREYGIATSTIGIGGDYDEAVMGGMAQAGQGFHYFAETAESIMDAFARERFLMGTLALGDVKLAMGPIKVDLGRLLSGEGKTAVVKIDKLPAKAKLSFVDAKTEERFTLEVPLPAEFGLEPIVSAYEMVDQAGNLAEETLKLRNPEAATELREATRCLLLGVLNHELCDDEPLKSLAVSLQASIDQLERLSRSYDEGQAAWTRKQHLQRSHSIKEPGKAFGMLAEDQALFSAMRMASYGDASDLIVDPRAFAIRPPEFWLQLNAAPIELHEGSLVVALVNPFHGFALEEISRELGLFIRPLKWEFHPDEIADAIRRAAGM